MNPRTDLPQILLGELEKTTGMFLTWFSDSKLSTSTFIKKISKIVIEDQARIYGGSKYK